MYSADEQRKGSISVTKARTYNQRSKKKFVLDPSHKSSISYSFILELKPGIIRL